MRDLKSKYEAVVIGVSAGGMDTVPKVIKGLESGYPLSLIMVQHTDAGNDFTFYIKNLEEQCALKVKIADEKERIMPGTLYIAPANYHLLVESDRTFSLSIDEKVNYCRPSIDVLFETAAEVFGDKLIGIILTGANRDGTDGMKAVKTHNGLAIVQNPSEAQVDAMPKFVITEKAYDKILTVNSINKFLRSIS